jgi:Probable lipoprotein LpqN
MAKEARQNPVTVRFPSEQFPARPAVSLQIPAEWEPIPSPRVLVAAGAIEDPEHPEFRVNVVVTSARFEAGFTLPDAVKIVVDQFSELPELTEIGREDRVVLGIPGFRYEASYADDRVGALVQLVHVAVLDRGSVADMVQVTATCTGDQALVQLADLRRIMDSAATEDK